jgi:two-component system response regulator FixJ
MDHKIFIIDDDQTVRESISLLMESIGLDSDSFQCAKDYLDQFDSNQFGCIVTDVRMPFVSGLELQNILSKSKHHPPIIFLSGHGDVSMAVNTMKKGAFDFIEKPFHPQYLIDSVNNALLQEQKAESLWRKYSALSERFKKLTNKEQEVFQLICKGKLNKQIASELNISQSTVEARRAKIMEKMNARNLVDLIKQAIELEKI